MVARPVNENKVDYFESITELVYINKVGFSNRDLEKKVVYVFDQIALSLFYLYF